MPPSPSASRPRSTAGAPRARPRRPSAGLAGLLAAALLAAAPAARAAELTRLPSSFEPGDPFDLDLSLRWERLEQRGVVRREQAAAPAPGQAFAAAEELPQLRLAAITNTVVPRLAIGLWRDLALHVELPWVLAHDVTWRPAAGLGVDVPDTIGGNLLDPDGAPCAASPCPLFPVGDGVTVYHGGRLGDLKVGLDWGILSDRRDDTTSSLVVGLDVTFPTAARYDPVAGRGQDWLLPWVAPGEAGPLGEKLWRWDLHATLSRRVGAVDPYLRVHATVQRASGATYSNCEHAAALESPAASAQGPQLRSGAAALCAADPARWGARPPFLAGLLFGAEWVAFQDPAAAQKIALDLRLGGEYTAAARWYNELTDATGKLHATGEFVTLSGRLGLHFRASEQVLLEAAAGAGYVTPHLLTGEPLDTAAENPNFDWRYDPPARRFRLAETTVFDLQFSGVLIF